MSSTECGDKARNNKMKESIRRRIDGTFREKDLDGLHVKNKVERPNKTRRNERAAHAVQIRVIPPQNHYRTNLSNIIVHHSTLGYSFTTMNTAFDVNMSPSKTTLSNSVCCRWRSCHLHLPSTAFFVVITSSPTFY